MQVQNYECCLQCLQITSKRQLFSYIFCTNDQNGNKASLFQRFLLGTLQNWSTPWYKSACFLSSSRCFSLIQITFLQWIRQIFWEQDNYIQSLILLRETTPFQFKMNVLILFPLKCSKRKLISSSLDEITVHKSLSSTYSRSTYFSSFLGREDRRGECIRKVRESLPFRLLGTCWYLFTVQIHSRNTILKSTAISKWLRFCYKRKNSHQNSSILWRSGCDYMKEKPPHTGRMDGIFPVATQKH